MRLVRILVIFAFGAPSISFVLGAQPAFKPVGKIAAPCQEGPYSPDGSNDSTFRVTCDGALHVFRGNTAPIMIDVPISRVVGDNLQALQNAGMLSATATVKVSAINKLMDLNCIGCASPVNIVKLNGHEIGNLIAGDGTWTVNTYQVPVEWLNFPQNDDPNLSPTPSLNRLEIDLDTANRLLRGVQLWNTKVDWAQATVVAARPILLVHGIISSGQTWFPLWNSQLSAAHVPFLTINLPSMGFRDIETNSQFIATTVATLKKQWGVDKINIVAHSKGGLDARDYMERHKREVERIVQIGSPNAGSPLADDIHNLTKHLHRLQTLLNGFAPIEYVLTTTYMKEYNSTHGYDETARYSAIAGVWHPKLFEISLWRLLTFLVGKGDGIVPRWSVHKLNFTQNISFETYGSDGAKHTKLTSQGFVYNMCAQLLGLPRAILPIFPPPKFGPFDADGDELPPVRKLATRGDLLAAGETAVQTIAVDESQPIAFSMVFPALDDVSMAVISPSGVRWDKDSIYPDDRGYEVSDYAGQPMITISFDQPEIGTWQVKVKAEAVVSNGNAPVTAQRILGQRIATATPETNYLLQVYMQQPSTQLSVALDRESVHVGESFRVRGTLTRNGHPLTGVSVTAEAALPDGTLLPFTLHDDGQAGDQTANDGVYTADLPANVGGGEYNFAITAKETRPGFIAFTREETVSGAAATSTTHVEGPFSDSAYSTNTEGQGLDTLAVRGFVKVDVPGHYHLLGTLRDANGVEVDSASQTVDSDAATVPVVFNFQGPSIYLSQKNGPYQFGAHVAEDLNDVLAVTQDDPNLYTTSAYNWFSFAPPDPGSRTDTVVVPSSVIVQYGNTTDVSATLTEDGLPLPGRSLRFVAAGGILGTAVTGADGVASIHGAPLPQFAAPGAQAMTVAFDGDLAYNPGSGSANFFINQGTQSIAWNTPADVVPGTILGPTQLNATVTGSGAAHGGDLTYDPPERTILSFGDHQPLTVTAAGSSFYPEATATVYINVRNPSAQVTWSNPADIVYGTPLTSAQLNATASTQGTFSYSPAANTILDAGASQALNVTFTPSFAGFPPVTRTVRINVLKATPSIQWAPPAGIVYGTPLSATQLNANSSVNAALTYAPAAGTVINAGHQTLTASSAATQNYNAATAIVTIDVAKATPSVSWTNPAGIAYGTALSSTQLNATAAVAGMFAYAPPAGTLLDAGSNQALTAVFTPNDPNYETRSITAHINVLPAAPSITWGDPTGIVYGTALSSTQLNAKTSVAGTFAYAPTAGTILDAGANQTLTAVFTPSDPNYQTQSASAHINVAKAAQTIHWSNPAAIVYGTALSSMQLNATVTVAGSSAAGALTYMPAAGVILHAGSQTLTANAAETGNYSAATASVALDVQKATPVVTWSTPAAIVYGTALSAAQLDAAADVPGTFIYSPAAGTILDAGSAQILRATFTPNDPADYNMAGASTLLDVAKAAQTISWSTPAPIVYGTALSTAQLNATVHVDGPSAAGAVTFSPDAGTVLHAGDGQTLTASVAGTPNYNPATATVLLNVRKAAPHVEWTQPAGIVYGTVLSATQLAATADVPGSFAYTPSAGTILNAGAAQTLSATFTPTDVANYETTSASVAIDVAKSRQSITWPSPSPIVYGSRLGTQLNAAVSVVGPAPAGALVYTPAAGTALDAGNSQTLTVAAKATDNYEAASATVTIDVTRAPLSLHVNDAAKLYGAPLPTLTGTVTGVVNGDNITPVYATTATAASSAGAYPIAGQLSDPASRLRNYDVTLVPARLTIGKAPLLVKADDATKQYSDPLPPLTASFSGFVLGESPAVLDGALVLQTTATKDSGPGTYPISAAGLTSPNYSITVAGGTLTVSPEDATVTFVAPRNIATSPVTGTATVALAAMVEELRATGDAGTLGDIRKATLTFIDRSTGRALCTAPIGLIDAANTSAGLATCTFAATPVSYTVASRVGGWYVRDDVADDVTITVTTAGNSFLTGGGWASLSASAGTYAADANTRATFNSNEKYDQSGVARGNLNLTFQRTENGNVHTYVVDASSITSLAIAASPRGGTAWITGSATLTDATTKQPVVVQDGATLLATFVDNGEPGSSDTIAISVIGKNGGLLFSSHWSGKQTSDQVIEGGNVQIHLK